MVGSQALVFLSPGLIYLSPESRAYTFESSAYIREPNICSWSPGLAVLVILSPWLVVERGACS